MKTNKYLVLSILLISLLAFLVTSQITEISPNNEFTQTTQLAKINDKIGLQEKQDCTIAYYNATENVYDYIPRTRNVYGRCFNSTNQTNYVCVNGTEEYQSYELIASQIVLRNNSDCRTNSFVISVTKGSTTEKKEVDFSSWGVCVKETENDCVAIVCGTLQGGSARNGIFNGCDGGKSCQKFLFCQDDIKVLYKASRDDFVAKDPTYHLSKLALKEVGE